MSYILEALRRADAERARGAVPGLNTPAPDAVDDESPTAPRPWPWLVAGVVVALGVVLAWHWAVPAGGPEAPVIASTSVPAVPVPIDRPSAVQASPTPPRSAEPAPQPTQAAGPTASEPSASTSPGRAASPGSPASAMAETRVDAPASQASRRASTTRESPSRKAAPGAAAASAAAPTPTRAEPAPRIYRQAELPEEIRRALPRLTIGGSIYSESAASRMIVINGQVLHEGEKLGADLSLRQIRLKEAVLEFRGYRYEVPY